MSAVVGVDLAQASTMVLGTLGLAAALVLLPQTWRFSSVFAALITKERVKGLYDRVAKKRRLVKALRVPIAVAFAAAPSLLALFWVAQLTLDIRPHRVLWQAVLSLALVWAYFKGKVERIPALVVAATFVFIADQGSPQAQTGAVVFLAWLLAFVGARHAIVSAPKFTAAVFEDSGVSARVRLRRLTFTVAYLATSLAAVVVLAWTVARL